MARMCKKVNRDKAMVLGFSIMAMIEKKSFNEGSFLFVLNELGEFWLDIKRKK